MVEIIIIFDKKGLVRVNRIKEGLRRNLLEFSGGSKEKKRLCFGKGERVKTSKERKEKARISKNKKKQTFGEKTRKRAREKNQEEELGRDT